jgi:hypothetical protein
MQSSKNVTKKIKLEAIRENYIKLNIYTLNDIKNHHKGHWFSKDTMRFFKSRVSGPVYCSKKACYFVSSESFNGTDRFYTVRKYNPKTKDINTVGEFNVLSKSEAFSQALELAFSEK